MARSGFLSMLCLLAIAVADLEQMSNQQCYVYETEYDGDKLHNPIFEGGGFIGSYTLDECWAHCETSTDSEGRPCVAIEWSDGGDAQSSTTTKKCALAWGCDYTKSWGGGSVYQMTAHYVAIGSTHQIGNWVPDGVESYCQRDDNNQAAYFSTVHDYDIGVGCCSQDGSYGNRPKECLHPATYQEAVDLCNSDGLRLCTEQEMLSMITRGTGCFFDAAYLWVSDECQYEVSTNAAAAVSAGEAIAEEANETNSAGNGSLDWVTTVIGAMIGVVAIGAVVVFLMLMTKKRKRAAEEEKTEMSKAVPEHVVPEMSISSVAVPVTTSGATVEE